MARGEPRNGMGRRATLEKNIDPKRERVKGLERQRVPGKEEEKEERDVMIPSMNQRTQEDRLEEEKVLMEEPVEVELWEKKREDS